jgi:hypothetical protein
LSQLLAASAATSALFVNLFLVSCAAIRRNYPKLPAFSLGVKNDQIALSALEILQFIQIGGFASLVLYRTKLMSI